MSTPQPTATPTAAPCVVCGTTQGALLRHEGRLIPVRIDGKCLDCVQHPKRKPVVSPPAPRPTVAPNNYPAQSTEAAIAAITIPGVGYASARGWARQRAIRDRLGAFITTTAAVPYPAPPAVPTDPSYDHRGRLIETRWHPAEWADDPATFTSTVAGRSHRQRAEADQEAA